MSDIWNGLLLTAITAVLSWGIKTLVSYLKTKTSQSAWELIDLCAQLAVEAAEQLFPGSKRGEEKKEYAMELLEHEFGYSKDEISVLSAAIESRVYSMNNYEDALMSFDVDVETIEDDNKRLDGEED